MSKNYEGPIKMWHKKSHLPKYKLLGITPLQEEVGPQLHLQELQGPTWIKGKNSTFPDWLTLLQQNHKLGGTKTISTSTAELKFLNLRQWKNDPKKRSLLLLSTMWKCLALRILEWLPASSFMFRPWFPLYYPPIPRRHKSIPKHSETSIKPSCFTIRSLEIPSISPLNRWNPVGALTVSWKENITWAETSKN